MRDLAAALPVVISDSEAEYRLRGGHERYSLDDVIANRSGALFGSAFFDDPNRLVNVCMGWGCHPRYGSGGFAR
jgi:hypothetical protein